MGYNYEDKGGLFKPNKYYDHFGNPVSRGQFWKDFDKQHQTEAIPVIDAIHEKTASNMETAFAEKKVLCPV